MSRRLLALIVTFLSASITFATTGTKTADSVGTKVLTAAEGFNGIWYQNQKQNDEYKYKYSGGFATYPQQHSPIAIYRPEVDKTFFCYGGTEQGQQELLHMIAYFDHKTKEVSQPRILLNKKTEDAHDNPVMSIDGEGYIYIFSPSHGGARPTFVSKSVRPHDISEFSIEKSFNFSYPQPHYISDKGFLFLHTRYTKGRALHMSTSEDGTSWTEPKLLALADQGHYQISAQKPDGTVVTAFNYHPQPGGLNARTNLNYMQTSDLGKTWTTADSKPISIPVTTSDSLSLVRDYAVENLLVYLKDIAFDNAGNPVILYLTTMGYESGPKNDPRTWYIAHWTGNSWDINDVTTSTHNYDFGSLYIESEGTWRIIAPLIPGPQKYNPGGDITVLTSTNEGKTWNSRRITHATEKNHTYVRRPLNAHPNFYALWADGDARNPSDSSLYFTDKTGSKVWRLPRQMHSPTAKPELVN